MSASISELKTQFVALHDKVSDYFQDELRLAKEKVQEVAREVEKEGRLRSEIYKVKRQYGRT